jgi:hypothetical protein
MTEEEARTLLRDCGIGSLERWAADQPWRAVPGGWRVEGDLRGTQFEIGNGPDHLRVIAWIEGAGPPAEWTVTAGACP